MTGTMKAAGTGGIVAGAAVFIVFACADPEGPPSGAIEPLGPVMSAEALPEEQANLRELTRLVAIALQDQGLRQRIKNDMRNSRFTAEHKLEFRRYIRGNSGGILLAKMANVSGRSREELLALVDGIRPLEFYMPVRKHREPWRGEAELLVASALDEEGTTLVGYDLSGQPVALSVTEPPETPTLVLVPVETDFSTPLDPTRYRNVNDQGGESIGTMADYCPPELCGGGSGGGGGGGSGGGDGGGGGDPFYPPGLYFERMRVWEDGEGWPRGEAELEVHLFGTQIGLYSPFHDPNTGLWTLVYHAGLSLDVPFSCAGERASGLRHFNFDGEGGTTFFETVLIANALDFGVDETIRDHVGRVAHRRLVVMNPPFTVRIIERDDGRACPKGSVPSSV